MLFRSRRPDRITHSPRAAVRGSRAGSPGPACGVAADGERGAAAGLTAAGVHRSLRVRAGQGGSGRSASDQSLCPFAEFPEFGNGWRRVVGGVEPGNDRRARRGLEVVKGAKPRPLTGVANDPL